MSGFNGNGTFLRIYNWVFDKAAGVKITYNRNDDEDTGIAVGLSSIVTKDGQQTTTGPISFAQGLRVSDGTVAAPGIAFINDPDTGVYRIGANNIAFASGGAKIIDFATATASMNATLVLGVPIASAHGGTNSGVSNTARVWNSGDQVLGHAASAYVTFDTTVTDTNSLVTATDQLTIQKSGTYVIVADVQWLNK